jgi:hypothetical protein
VYSTTINMFLGETLELSFPLTCFVYLEANASRYTKQVSSFIYKCTSSRRSFQYVSLKNLIWYSHRFLQKMQMTQCFQDHCTQINIPTTKYQRSSKIMHSIMLNLANWTKKKEVKECITRQVTQMHSINLQRYQLNAHKLLLRGEQASNDCFNKQAGY